MNDIDAEQDQLVRSLARTHLVPATTLDPSGPAAGELLRQILTGDPHVRSAPRPAPRSFWRRRLVAAVASVAAAAAVTFGAAVLPSDRTGPVGPVPAQAHALQFTESDGILEIRIKDPAADPERYRREIAGRGLDIELRLAPARPDQVGRVVFIDESTPGITSLEQPGECSESGNCSVGVRVPVNYRGRAVIVFGRKARPGEPVPGGTTDERTLAESLVGRTVAEAKQVLAAAGKVPSFYALSPSRNIPADRVVDSWIVIEAAPVPGNVMHVWVSADGTVPPSPAGTRSTASR